MQIKKGVEGNLLRTLIKGVQLKADTWFKSETPTAQRVQIFGETL